MKKQNEPILCYVEGAWAYFTTQSLLKQWGDDWDDAPYEHNAGTPYEYYEHDRRLGKKPWMIIKVAFDGDLVAPNDGVSNSNYSVEEINRGDVPWLREMPWINREKIEIWAGTTLSEFKKLVKRANGSVYEKTI